jgi:60 kDa SS-A/Ro ribonucleoprotein
MSKDVLTTISTRQTPQSRAARSEQVENAAGGYSFKVGDAERLRRFLLLGSDGPTYYTSAKDLTQANAAVVLRMAASKPLDLISEIVAISTAGRSPRPNTAIFALAIASSPPTSVEGRTAALAALTQVCRTSSHLFLFVRYVEQFRGWGPALQKAVSRWYTEKSVDKLAYQLAKYRQREGESHAATLRRAHPAGVENYSRRMALNWAVGKGLNDYPERLRSLTQAELKAGERLSPRRVLDRVETVPDELGIIADFEDAAAATTVKEWLAIIGRGHGLSWEMLPDAALTQAAVWEALLHSERGVPQTALIKQLPRLTNLGLCVGDTGKLIIAQLNDVNRLKWGRVHPINILVAQRTYASGRGMRGHSTWIPVPNITGGLNDAFYTSFGVVEPAGNRTLAGVDVSGSMSCGSISGLPLQPREVAGALAMVLDKTEPEVTHVGFTTSAWGLDISKYRRLDDVLHYLYKQPSGGTDCSLPILFALQNKIAVDTFMTYTDGESWYGLMHPFQALEMYRQQMGIPARLVSVAMTATGTSINRPDDAGTLDCVGFDTAVPQLANDFAAGRV